MLTLKYFITCLVLAFPIASHATCLKVTSTSALSSEIIAAGYTATSWVGTSRGTGGNIGLPSVISMSSGDSFMPAGTLLASSTASFLTAAASTAFTANQILYKCDLADAGSLYEFYATQSYSALAGLNETSDIEGAYHTYYNGLAIRLTNLKTGNYFNGYWQKRVLTEDEYITDSTSIYIPASAFSDVFVEVFKTASTVYTNSATAASRSYYAWSNNMASGFITFVGPGRNALVEGNLEANNYDGWSTYWTGQIALYNDVTIVKGAMCLVKDYPTVVLLPTISTVLLNSGESSQNTFDISLSCEDGAVSSVSQSSTSSSNVAMGFLVNQSTAVTAATTLGLTSTSGLTHLLDTNYGSSGVASGVGIRIYDESGNALNLLSSKTATTGNAGGWYAYKDLTTSQGDSTDGVTTYTGNFTASLEAISGETVTAGSVNAQLQVVVSFQ
jgi:type 1 fimbria pilin